MDPQFYVYEIVSQRYKDSWEDSPEPRGIHLTKAGAYRSMRRMITSSYEDWYDERILEGKERGEKPFPESEYWIVRVPVLP